MPSPFWRQPANHRMTRRAAVVVIGLLLLAGLVAGFYLRGATNSLLAYPSGETLTPSTARSSDADHCSVLMPLAQSQALINRLDRSEASFASTTQDVMGQTTEGGEQTTYTQAGVRQVVEQRFYKETGRSTARIYYASGKPFALIVQNMKYAVPLSVDNNGDVQSTEERAYFLDDTGIVCTWQLNGKSQPVDDSTIESVKTYLAGVH